MIHKNSEGFRSRADPKLDIGEGIIQHWTLGGPYLCFQAKSFLTPLFSIGNTNVWVRPFMSVDLIRCKI